MEVSLYLAVWENHSLNTKVILLKTKYKQIILFKYNYSKNKIPSLLYESNNS